MGKKKDPNADYFAKAMREKRDKEMARRRIMWARQNEYLANWSARYQNAIRVIKGY